MKNVDKATATALTFFALGLGGAGYGVCEVATGLAYVDAAHMADLHADQYRVHQLEQAAGEAQNRAALGLVATMACAIGGNVSMRFRRPSV